MNRPSSRRRALTAAFALSPLAAALKSEGAAALKAEPVESAALTREELAKWEPVVQAFGMKID